jgi:hypothetical protein
MRLLLNLAGAALAVGAMLVGAGSAKADAYVTWESGSCLQAAPCFQAPGFVGSNLTSNVPTFAQAQGYVGLGDPWSVVGPVFGNAAKFDLSMTTSVGGYVNYFSFVPFNNDCENNGNIVNGCVGLGWSVSMSVNGGAFSSIGSVGYGTPYSTNTVYVPLDLTLAAGESVAFELTATGGVQIPTGQYFITNQEIGVPEPASMMVLGAGLAGLGVLRRRRG